MSWSIDSTRILTEREIAAVLTDLRRRARRSINSRQNLIVFRLATCCGLRVSEICGLNLSDVRTGIDRPYVQVRAAVAKGRKARRVPLWWDGGTLADLEAWKRERQAAGAKPGDPFVCGQTTRSIGNRLDRFNARHRFGVACRALGPDRVAHLTIHDGRHTFVSHALRHRTLAEVREAAGHSSVATTSLYTHVAVDDDGKVGAMFGAVAETA